MMMIFFDQIYKIVLPIRQVLQTKLFVRKFFFGLYLLRKIANMQKCNVLKKLCPGFFFKGDTNIWSFHKSENITLSVFQKRLTWCFRIFDNLHFFNHLWKKTQGIVFSKHKIFAYLPPSAINWDRKQTFDQLYFFAKLFV